jgi:hypothetical protein
LNGRASTKIYRTSMIRRVKSGKTQVQCRGKSLPRLRMVMLSYRSNMTNSKRNTTRMWTSLSNSKRMKALRRAKR